MSHTPGPWWNELGVIHAKAPNWTEDNHATCHPAICYGRAGREALANGDLCAAALDLLAVAEAVEWVYLRLMFTDKYQRACPWCKRFDAEGHAPDCPRQLALAKARGGE